MPNIQSAICNGRMSPEWPLALGHLETAHNLKGFGAGSNQAHVSALLVIAIQHAIRIDHGSLVAIPSRVVLLFAVYPSDAGPVAAAVARPV